jgi:hypothetical protein
LEVRLEGNFNPSPWPPPELVFMNISCRAEILGFDFKTGYSAKPNQILIHRHFSSRIWEIARSQMEFWSSQSAHSKTDCEDLNIFLLTKMLTTQ